MDQAPMRHGDERQIKFGGFVFTVIRRSADYMVSLGDDRDHCQFDPDYRRAIGALVVEYAQRSLPERYDWLIRWHVQGEPENVRESRMLGIASTTAPGSVWQMIKAVNPTAFCDEITNLTLEGDPS